MPDEEPKIDEKELKEKAAKDPKSKRWNNPNSRKNLKQYKKKEEIIFPEVVLEEEEEDGSSQAREIVYGRKLSPELVKKLIPQRGTFTLPEKKRFTGIVQQYLADFKNEEPTASDCDDIFEIAKSDILEMRVLQATKDDAGALLQANQFLDKINKRKQTAKENLSARRSDRRDARLSQGVTIVDLVVQFDLNEKKIAQDRIKDLLKEEEVASKDLRDIILQGDG